MTKTLAEDVARGLRPPTLAEIPLLPLTTTVPIFGAWIGLSRGPSYRARAEGVIEAEEIGGRLVVIVPKALARLGVPMTESEAPASTDATATTDTDSSQEPIDAHHPTDTTPGSSPKLRILSGP